MSPHRRLWKIKLYQVDVFCTRRMMPVPVGGCTAVPHEVKKKEAFTRRALQMPGVTATTVLGAAFLQPYRSESVPISVSRERNGGARPLSLRFCIRAARKPCPFSIQRSTTGGNRALPGSWGPHRSAFSLYSQGSFFPLCAFPPGMRHGCTLAS